MYSNILINLILLIFAAKDAQGMTNDQKDIVKGLTIYIKQLHLRYEDDYYSSECPYSFGLVIDVSIIFKIF